MSLTRAELAQVVEDAFTEVGELVQTGTITRPPSTGYDPTTGAVLGTPISDSIRAVEGELGFVESLASALGTARPGAESSLSFSNTLVIYVPGADFTNLTKPEDDDEVTIKGEDWAVGGVQSFQDLLFELRLRRQDS